MQKVFENIIDKLEEYKYENLVEHDSEESQHCKDVGDCDGMDCSLCVFDKAIEIVKQEAAEYNNDQINRLAMMYAKNIVLYGVDITKIWDTATQQTAALNQAYIRGRQDERDRFEQYNNGWIPCSERLPENISK